MSRILEDVEINHLRSFPSEREAVLPFVAEFDITWAARRSAYGSEFSSYIIKPNPTIRSLFGLGMEVALFIFDYPTVEPRTFQAIGTVLEEQPLSGRVEPSIYFIVSRDPKAGTWVSDYLTRTAQIRTAIPLSFGELRSALTDRYVLRDLIAKTLYRRDLFDYKLPINDDVYFFGRESIVSEIVDQVKKGQNSGIFGLRKTGKTSLLYKIQRHLEANGLANCIYIDCKSPAIRKKTGENLIDYLTRQLSERFSIPNKHFSKLDAYEAFVEVARLASKKSALCLIFDEIEYISPYSPTDSHWADDFIDFWQLMWSTQSSGGHVSFIVCGVNAAVCETDQFQTVQNPLFGIFNNKYIQGLDQKGLRMMINHFGGIMGLNFAPDAISLLEKHYGGHSLLTRMACSHIHRDLENLGKRRPVDITEAMVKAQIPNCDHDITPYCTHIVSELKLFYPTEFEVLRMSAIGLKTDFNLFGRDVELTRHLRSYGIVRFLDDGTPEIVLPVLRSYLKAEYLRESGSPIAREIIHIGRRDRWVKETISRIVFDLRTNFQSAPEEVRRPFGGRGLPDSDILMEVTASGGKDDTCRFLSKFYNVFYENVLRSYGKAEFSTTFMQEWPDLFRAIHRIRTYRDYYHHLDVSDKTRDLYNHYLAVDLDGQPPDTIPDGWFVVQQVILDELLYAAQKELAAKVQ